MTTFQIVALIECDTAEQADIVASERFGYDEQYDDRTGPFDYSIDMWVVSPLEPGDEEGP